MPFHVRLSDYPVPRRTSAMREAHWQYLDQQADHIIARGPTQSDDGTVMRSSLFFVDFADRAAVERFVAEEPTNRAGAYMSVEILGWVNALGRRQSDFPRKEGQVYWYIRGDAKPDAHLRREALLEAHKAYLKPYEAEHFIARGSLRNDAGQWIGSVNLIALPDRKTAEVFAADEPFCKNGLFKRVVIERFKPGGPPIKSITGL